MAKDKGQEYTDSVISELEKKIQKEYKQANDEVQQKVDNYFARFAKKDQKKQTQLKAGYITQDEYNQWRYGQVCVGERWKELKQNLAEDYVNANQIARAMVADKQADVYALNHNFATYQVEHDSLMDTSYTLYNRRTVQNLVKDNPRLLPYLSKDSPTAKKLSERMDLIWNRQKINSAITQGVLQGESIPQISKRLEKVTDMNHSAAVRNARTMMTSCENKGRQDAYDSLRDKGIDLAEKWVATLDGRTRHSHRHLHGTYKDPKTGLYENGLEYPGDPFGEPEEIYNCRCCEVAEVLGFKIDTPTTSPKLGDMSFDEWLNAKGDKESLWWYKDKKEITLQDYRKKSDEGIFNDVDKYKFGKMISDYTPVKTIEEAEQYADQFVSQYKTKYSGNVSYKGIDIQFANTSNQVLAEIYQRYDIDPLANITPMNKRDKKFKNTSADAAYQWGGSGGNLFINGAFYKNTKTLNAHIDEANNLLSTVLENTEVLLKGDISQQKRDYIEALIESGCQAVGQKLPKEEFARCTFIHETGHMLDDKLFGTIMKEKGFDVQESMGKYAKQISGYAITSRQEYIAESFASYWYGFDIDPELAKIFKGAEKK